MKVDHYMICGGTSPVTSPLDRDAKALDMLPWFRHMMHISWSDALGPPWVGRPCALFRARKRKLGRPNLGRSDQDSRKPSVRSDQYQSGSCSRLGGPWHHHWNSATASCGKLNMSFALDDSLGDHIDRALY